MRIIAILAIIALCIGVAGSIAADDALADLGEAVFFLGFGVVAVMALWKEKRKWNRRRPTPDERTPIGVALAQAAARSIAEERRDEK